MIYDTLDRIGEYRGMGEWLDRAIDFLENTERLPSGRTEIAGTDCFINVMETVTKEETQADFEVHRKYMDIQIDLEGMEEIQIGGTTEGEKFPYSEEMDFGTVLCEKKAACLLGRGRFILCMAGEPHKPGRLKKCVIKVRV